MVVEWNDLGVRLSCYAQLINFPRRIQLRHDLGHAPKEYQLIWLGY